MIGLIFGETHFPIQILKKVKNRHLKYLIIDLTKGRFKKDKHSYNVSIGQFGKIIKILKDNKCKKVLFAGKVKKPNFSKLRLDFKGLYYIPRIIKNSNPDFCTIFSPSSLVNPYVLLGEGISTSEYSDLAPSNTADVERYTNLLFTLLQPSTTFCVPTTFVILDKFLQK